MVNVQFDENQFQSHSLQNYQVNKPTWLTGLVIRTGLAKDTKTAQLILFGITIICIVTATIIFMSTGPEDYPKSDIEMLEEAARFNGFQ